MFRLVRCIGALVGLVAGVGLLQAQDISQQFISVRSGLVNYLDGNPVLYRGSKDSRTLVVRDQLRAGDRIQVRDLDRLELLLNPGSYLRVSGKAELQVVRTALDDMRFGITDGMMIVESAVFNRKTHALQVLTPAGEVRILEQGLYKFEVNAPDRVSVSVFKGQAKWSKDNREIATLKSGKRFELGTSAGGSLKVSKLDKVQMSEFDLWSRRRAEYLVAANSRMSLYGRESAFNGYGYGYGYGYRSLGGWAYNPFYNCYTFVPFGSAYMSPYGYAYNNYYAVYRGPTYGGSSGGSSSQPSAPSTPRYTTVDVRSAATVAPAAPAQRMDTGRSDTSSRSGVHSGIRK